MKIIVAAIHGIMNRTTDPSWPDRFEGYLLRRDPQVRVEKRKYFAAPFPRWNCWVKDPLLARGLASELEVLADSAPSYSIWFVAHSNGAVISWMAAKRLIARGYKIGGLILTGAAVEADIQRNGILNWWSNGKLGAAIAYASQDDEVVAGDPRAVGGHFVRRLRAWCWGKAMWPYGCLGRSGWYWNDKPVPERGVGGSVEEGRLPKIFTRWQRGGHSTYFTPGHQDRTFEQMYVDMEAVNR